MIKRLYNYLSDNAIFADFKSKSSSDYKSMHKKQCYCNILSYNGSPYGYSERTMRQLINNWLKKKHSVFVAYRGGMCLVLQN